MDVEFYRGSKADLADAPKTDGAFVYTTDTHELFIGDGEGLLPLVNTNSGNTNSGKTFTIDISGLLLDSTNNGVCYYEGSIDDSSVNSIGVDLTTANLIADIYYDYSPGDWEGKLQAWSQVIYISWGLVGNNYFLTVATKGELQHHFKIQFMVI